MGGGGGRGAQRAPCCLHQCTDLQAGPTPDPDRSIIGDLAAEGDEVCKAARADTTAARQHPARLNQPRSVHLFIFLHFHSCGQHHAVSPAAGPNHPGIFPCCSQDRGPPKTLSVQMSLTPQLLSMHPALGRAMSASGGRAGKHPPAHCCQRSARCGCGMPAKTGQGRHAPAAGEGHGRPPVCIFLQSQCAPSLPSATPPELVNCLPPLQVRQHLRS